MVSAGLLFAVVCGIALNTLTNFDCHAGSLGGLTDRVQYFINKRVCILAVVGLRNCSPASSSESVTKLQHKILTGLLARVAASLLVAKDAWPYGCCLASASLAALNVCCLAAGCIVAACHTWLQKAWLFLMSAAWLPQAWLLETAVPGCNKPTFAVHAWLHGYNKHGCLRGLLPGCNQPSCCSTCQALWLLANCCRTCMASLMLHSCSYPGCVQRAMPAPAGSYCPPAAAQTHCCPSKWK